LSRTRHKGDFRPMKPQSSIFGGAFSLLMAGTTALAVSVPLIAVSSVSAQAAALSGVDVRGNTRISADAILGYIGIRVGEQITAAAIDEAVKALFNTGLFADVRVTQSGSRLVVSVVEQALVNQPIFQGNRKIKDRDLAARVQLQSRTPFSQEALDADIAAIQDAYAAIGRNNVSVTGETMESGDGRVNVVFNIDEGDRTKIASVTFAGNDSYGDGRLRQVISTKRSNLLSGLLRDDVYSEDRLRTDEDKLRNFYFNRGYADFQIVSSAGDFDAASNAYNVAFTIEEGARYRYGEITLDSTIPDVNTAVLSRLVGTRAGGVYSASEIEDTIIALQEKLAADGFAFAQVTPRGDRNFSDNTISITYTIDQGPRLYVERIEIRGNDRTRDYVIRREFDISEGDALNQVMIQRARKRLEALGFFSRVNISTVAGSEPDRVVLVVEVEDQATGDIGIGAGYSIGGDDSGVQLEGSITERNLLGRGQFLKLAIGGSADSRTYTISFTEPYFLGSRISAGFDIQNQTKSYDSYSKETNGATIRFGLPITEALSAQLAYNYSEERYECDEYVDGPDGEFLCRGVTSAQLLEDIERETWVKSSLATSLAYNTLDNRQDPREGIFARGTLEFAGLGGDASYLKATASATYYQPLVEDANIIGLISIGAGHIAELSDGGLRSFDLFRSSTSIIRGFDSNGIGPYDTVGKTHVGGATYFKATAEAQFPLPFLPENLGLRGAVFADAATIHGNDLGTGEIVSNEMNWRSSVGVGIAWASPFGPLRFDYAVPVQKEETDKVREFSFGVSTRF
jgi:outer membrane protein insertion porin family